jgi:tetratricopeptide (TPR) repeat protein
MTHAKSLCLAFCILLPVKLIYADGLPGEYLLSNKWRQVFANQSPVDNPAMIMEEPYLKVRGALSFSSGDPARVWELGATMPIRLYQTVGLTIMGENGNDVVGYVFQNQDLLKAGTTRNNNFLFMGSYAINPWGKISVGSNLNLVYQGNFGEPGWGLGADLGISYRITDHPDFGYHVVGIAYRNLFSPKVSASKDMPYSAQIKTQYHASFFKNRMFVDYQICMSDLNSRPSLFLDNRKFDWDMELQVGVSPIPYLKMMAFTDINQWNDLGSFGLVFGVNMPNVNMGKELAFHYQFRQNLQADLLGSHSLYGSAQLGRHREELYAMRLVNKGKYALNNLYTRAMRSYHNQDYWDAYFAFSRLLADYPKFFKSDAVAYFAASCLEFLDMRSAALQAYKKVKEKYPQSSYAVQADLGILRLYYRNGNYVQVKRQYEVISGSDVSDSIKQHAAYYMGETEIILGNYKQAASVFEQITEDHSLYSFAQHSLATVHVFLNSGNRVVEMHLLNAINGQVAQTAAQKEIVNRSLIMLGYLYYEEKAMAKAVTALRMIPKESYYYEDAQLGLGWAAVKSRQWQDCIDVGKQIEAVSKKKIIQSEGQLLQAYGYLLQKNYSVAEKYLMMASKTMEGYKLAGDDVSKKHALQYDSIRTTYDSLAEEITRIARINLIKITDDKINGLHKKQKMLKQNIDLNIRNADEHRRIRFFEKAFLKLREDLEYALVTVLRIRNELEQKKDQQQNENSPDDQIDGIKSK